MLAIKQNVVVVRTLKGIAAQPLSDDPETACKQIKDLAGSTKELGVWHVVQNTTTREAMTAVSLAEEQESE